MKNWGKSDDNLIFVHTDVAKTLPVPLADLEWTVLACQRKIMII